MSNSTTLVDTVSTSQAQKEVTVNAALDAASQSMIFGRRASTTSALTWGYYGGRYTKADATNISVANGTLTLTAEVTNYVEVDNAGAITVNSSAFTAGRTPLYAVVAGVSTVTSYTDHRDGTQGNFLSRSAAAALSDGDKGDITVSASGATWTIDNDAVSYDKMQNVSATDKLLGRSTSGAGNVEEIACTAAGRALLDAADAAAQRTTLGLGTAATLTSDTDTTLAANSDTLLATQKAVKAYVDSIVTGGASDVMIFKGIIDCSANPNYPAADAGNLHKVSVAGKIGGASGPNVETGDTIYCITDATSAGNHATVGANWVISQVNIDGAVTGPASATDGHVVLFDGTTGKLIKSSGLTLAGTNTGDETTTTAGALINGATGKTTPVDADYIGLMDSAASNVLKKLSWANLKATLKTYFDTLYAPINPKVCLAIACSDETTAVTSGTNKAKFINPYSTAFNVTAVVASLSTAQASGSIFTVDINEAGTSILSTKLTIDNTETNSSTAATAAVISDASIAAYAEIEVDVDQVGDGTAKGLKIYVVGYPS